MIRDILYLIVYFITETVLYSLAYRTVLSRGITNKAVKWMVYIIAVVITGSIVYVNNNPTVCNGSINIYNGYVACFYNRAI